MQQHGSKYFARTDPQTLEMGPIGQNSNFSKHGHVSYSQGRSGLPCEFDADLW